MEMKTITIKLPESVGLSDRDATIYLVSRLFEIGILSLSQASEVVGMSKRDFISILKDYGVSIFNYSPEDLEKDLQNVRNHYR